MHQTPAGASSSVRSGSDSRDPAGDHLDSVDTTVRKDDDASQIGIDTEDETTRGVNTELTYCVNGLCVYRIYE